MIELRLSLLFIAILSLYRYRNISFSLRDSKNVGLYRRVVSGEVLPADLVQMTTGQLIPESSNNGKEAKNSSNTDNGPTRGKTHDKQTSVVNYSSGDMARKNANIQLKNQSSTQHVSEDHKSKQGSSHDTKQSKFQTNKLNDIPESSEVDIPQPKFSPTLSDSDEHPEWDKVVWKGCISMPNLAKCVTNGYLAYGHHVPDMEKILPENVQVHGRIVYSMVWDYLKKIVSSTTKGLVVLKLVPETGVEQLSFTTLFNYFYKRQRCGVAGGCTAAVRDLYLLPFTKGDTIPTVLTSLQGPGISSLKEDTLLAMIVTNKLAQGPPNALASKKIGSETDAIRAADARNTHLKPKEDSTSLTNPSAPLPFSNLQSKSELPFSSNTEHSTPATGSDTFASPLFNPSGLYKPISENEGQDRKDSYMIPYDKVEKETPFNLSLGSKSASDHMFPALGEILKKTIDDPIIDDALSNFQFKKPIKDDIIPEQKLHGEYGYQFQDQFGYGNPSYPGSEPRPGEAAYTDIHGARPPVQQPRPHSNFPPDPNVDQFDTGSNQGYYGHDPLAPPHGQPPHPVYPPHSQGGAGHTQEGPENREYWQQGVRDPPHHAAQLEGFSHHQNQPGHPESFERYPPHHWQQPNQGMETTQPSQERHHPFDPPHHFPHTQPHDMAHPSEYPHPAKPGYPPPGQFHQEAESRLPSQHPHPLEHAESHHFKRERGQEHPENNLHRLPSHQNEHENNYRDPRRDFPPREDKYDPYSENERQPYHALEAKEKERDLYHPPDDWKPPYAREEDRWVGNDRRQRQPLVSDEVYRDLRFEREERERLEMERARAEYGRIPETEFLDRARLEERALPPFMRRRLPLRTSLSHHLDLARRDLAFPGRGKAFPLGLGVGPSLIERERARMKREYPLDKDVMGGAPFKVYRSMESPPKPSFEPISRSRPTLRVRKRERERDRSRKREGNGDAVSQGRGEDKSADLPKDESESQASKRREKKSSRRRTRSSKNKDTSEKPQETAEEKSDTVTATPEKTDIPDTTDTTEAVPDSNTTQEVYPQVVQVVQEGAENIGLEKTHEPPQSEETHSKLSEDESSMKFPPKHLQREKLLAMKEKLQTERDPPHSSKSRASERGERKRRSKSRSRDRESRSGRKRRSRSRDRRRAHSRDEIIREKEGASLREIGRDRVIREREEVPRRESPPLFRERQLLALEREREREILRARARMSLPSPSTLEAIRDRSPLHMTNLDPRRPIITPYMRARALDELRRERLDRGVPPGFRGQYLYQDPRPL